MAAREASYAVKRLHVLRALISRVPCFLRLQSVHGGILDDGKQPILLADEPETATSPQHRKSQLSVDSAMRALAGISSPFAALESLLTHVVTVTASLSERFKTIEE